jgi:hypothetical protein
MGEVEERTAKAAEQLVHSNAFGELLARVTQNVMGLTKIGFDVMDLTVRNLRLAGRPDITRLGAQLARTEDKLERVLQEVERLQQQVPAEPSRSRSRSSNGSARSTRTRPTNGRSRAKSSS